MYLMYVDESGDVGMGEGGSDYFVLSGLVVHEGSWNTANRAIVSLKEDLAARYGFDSQRELHASDLIGRSGNKRGGLSRKSALLMLKDVLKFEATMDYIRIINVVVNKKGKGEWFDPFWLGWERLINRFETTMYYKNFPSPWDQKPDNEKGFLVVDKTDEKKLRNMIRRMRVSNNIPSAHYPDTSVDAKLHHIVEDPMHKDSTLSYLIQLADVNAYFLKQYVDPNSTVKKHKARNYFCYLEPVLLKEACRKNDLGIVEA